MPTKHETLIRNRIESLHAMGFELESWKGDYWHPLLEQRVNIAFINEAEAATFANFIIRMHRRLDEGQPTNDEAAIAYLADIAKEVTT